MTKVAVSNFTYELKVQQVVKSPGLELRVGNEN